MITKENLEQLEKTLAESGLTIPQKTLKENFKNHPEGFEMRVTRTGKNGLEDSTLYFQKTDKGIYTQTEIKEKNFNFLANLLLDTEIDASVLIKLREAMSKGLSEIEIENKKTVFNQDTVSKLNFSYAPANGFHYWNNYTIQLLGLQKGEQAGIPQKVFIDSQKWTNNYTPEEMATLLQGGTVKKEFISAEGNFYIQEKVLDFTKVDKHGNFIKEKKGGQQSAPDNSISNQDRNHQSTSTSSAKNQDKNQSNTQSGNVYIRNIRRTRRGMGH